MTVRTAELLFAILLALCSIGLMIKSAELRIDWVPERGPGSGAWPFWLSAGMLLACVATIIRWFRKVTPESRNYDLYMTRETALLVGISSGIDRISTGCDTLARHLRCIIPVSPVLLEICRSTLLVGYGRNDDRGACVYFLFIRVGIEDSTSEVDFRTVVLPNLRSYVFVALMLLPATLAGIFTP